MNYSIRRPSGHVIKRGQADIHELNYILDEQLKKRGGYLEVFDESEHGLDVPIISGGKSFLRTFVQDYQTKEHEIIGEGALAQVLSVNNSDVHVDLYAENVNRCERWTFPRHDFMRATKTINRFCV